MNKELIEALNLLEKEKKYQQGDSAGSNREFSADRLQEPFRQGR